MIKTRLDRVSSLDLEVERLRKESATTKPSVERKDQQIRELNDQNQQLLSQLHSQEADLRQSRISEEKVQLFEKTNEQLAEKNRALSLELKEAGRELRVQRRLNEEYSQQMAEMKSAFAREAPELEAISVQFPDHERESLGGQIESLKQKSQDDRRKLSESHRQVSELKEQLADKDSALHEREQAISELTAQVRETNVLREELDSRRFSLDESTRTREKLSAKLAKRRFSTKFCRMKSKRFVQRPKNSARLGWNCKVYNRTALKRSGNCARKSRSCLGPSPICSPFRVRAGGSSPSKSRR
jgi:chromosome segregation ATPase